MRPLPTPGWKALNWASQLRDLGERVGDETLNPTKSEGLEIGVEWSTLIVLDTHLWVGGEGG